MVVEHLPLAAETSTLTMGDSGVALSSTRLDSSPVLDQISLFIDKVANDMQLGPHYRAMLHRFKQVRATCSMLGT